MTGPARAWLDAHTNRELGVGVPVDGAISPSASGPEINLENMQRLLSLIGEPNHAFPAIHIGGTTGKTSTTRIIAALLQNMGLSTGSYTSPHLERLNERMMWNGESITDEELNEQLDALQKVEPHADAPLTFFEITTAAALSWFADVAVDVAAIEVGLGGKADATNLLNSVVTVITNIDIDHTEYFGNSRQEIAQAEAEIIQQGRTLVLGETDSELRSAFLTNAPYPVYVRDVNFGLRANKAAHGGRLLSLFTPKAQYSDVFLSLHGAHQSQNAALALMAVEAFFDQPIPEDVVVETFASMTSPGRLEVVGHQPLVLLDGAHNVAGARALQAALTEEFLDEDRTLVVGFLREKDPIEMLEALGAGSAQHIIACKPPSPRAHDPEVIRKAVENLGWSVPCEVIEDPQKALTRALEITPSSGQIVITGSLYLVGAARSVLVSR